jgi:hypothetical protein
LAAEEEAPQFGKEVGAFAQAAEQALTEAEDHRQEKSTKRRAGPFAQATPETHSWNLATAEAL